MAAQSPPLPAPPSDDAALGPLQELSARDIRPPKLAFPLRERFGMDWHDIFGEESAPRLPHFQRPPLSEEELMMYSANHGLASSLSRGVKVQNQPPRLLSLSKVLSSSAGLADSPYARATAAVGRAGRDGEEEPVAATTEAGDDTAGMRSASKTTLFPMHNPLPPARITLRCVGFVRGHLQEALPWWWLGASIRRDGALGLGLPRRLRDIMRSLEPSDCDCLVAALNSRPILLAVVDRPRPGWSCPPPLQNCSVHPPLPFSPPSASWRHYIVEPLSSPSGNMISTSVISRTASYSSFSTQCSYETGLDLQAHRTTPLDDDDDPHCSASSSDSDDDHIDEKPRLGNDISRCLDKSEFDGCDFLPEGHIEALVTEDAVRQFLSYHPSKSDPPSSSRIRRVISHIFATGAKRGAKRLLAVVILVGLTGDAALQALHRFERAGIDDGSLPIRNIEECPGFYSKKTGDPFDPWDKVKINNFRRDQWRVMAHVFTKEGSESILRLDVDCILPIVSQSETESAHGAFGWVKRVTFHENHHLDPIIKVSNSLARRHEKHPLRGFALTRSHSTTVLGPTWPSRTISYRETNRSGNGRQRHTSRYAPWTMITS